MTRHDPKVSFLQMRDAVKEILFLTKNKSKEEIEKDRVLNLALTRLLEVIGEAASRVPTEIRSKHSNVPWSQVIGLRNRLIHAYDQIDQEVLWEIISEDLPALYQQLEKLIPDLK